MNMFEQVTSNDHQISVAGRGVCPDPMSWGGGRCPGPMPGWVCQCPKSSQEEKVEKDRLL